MNVKKIYTHPETQRYIAQDEKGNLYTELGTLNDDHARFIRCDINYRPLPIGPIYTLSKDNTAPWENQPGWNFEPSQEKSYWHWFFNIPV